MEIFIATTAAIAAVGAVVGAVAGLYAAAGVHRVEGKLNTLTERVDEQGGNPAVTRQRARTAPDRLSGPGVVAEAETAFVRPERTPPA